MNCSLVDFIIILLLIFYNVMFAENPNEMLPMEHTYEELDLLPEIPDGSKVIKSTEYLQTNSQRWPIQNLRTC